MDPLLSFRATVNESLISCQTSSKRCLGPSRTGVFARHDKVGLSTQQARAGLTARNFRRNRLHLIEVSAAQVYSSLVLCHSLELQRQSGSDHSSFGISFVPRNQD
jgi:hypothetical protein